MSRGAIARLAARALPHRPGAGGADEVAGTMLDAAGHSWWAFAFEVISVLSAGTVERARATTAQPAGPLLRAALGWAAVVSLARLLAINLYAGFALRWPSSVQALALAYVLPALVLLLWTASRRRTAGLVGVIWGAWYLAYLWTRLGVHPFAGILVPALGFVAIAATPARARFPHRLSWLIPATLLAVNVFALHSVVLGFVIFGVALCLIPLAPAFGLGIAMACSIAALSVVIADPPPSTALVTELIVCPLLALVIIAGTKRLLPTRS